MHTVRFPAIVPPSEVDVRVEALRETGEAVETTVVHTATRETRAIRSRYVLGADGGSSTVRRLAGTLAEALGAAGKPLLNVVDKRLGY